MLHTLIFLLCVHLFSQYRFIFPVVFVLSYLFLWRMHFFYPFCFFLWIVRVIVRSPGQLCLSLGASGYLGARQSRGTAAAAPRARNRQPRVA